MLIFRDYVEICNSSVDGFIQHVSYFFAPLIDTYICFRYWCLSQIYYYYYYYYYDILILCQTCLLKRNIILHNVYHYNVMYVMLFEFTCVLLLYFDFLNKHMLPKKNRGQL